AVAIAVAHDTQLSPVDVRYLTLGMRAEDNEGVYFETSRAKTNLEAFATISKATELLIERYLAGLAFVLPADQPFILAAACTQARTTCSVGPSSRHEPLRLKRAPEAGRDSELLGHDQPGPNGKRDEFVGLPMPRGASAGSSHPPSDRDLHQLSMSCSL